MGSFRETILLYHQLLENPTGSMTKNETDESRMKKNFLSIYFLVSADYLCILWSFVWHISQYYLPEIRGEINNSTMTTSTLATAEDVPHVTKTWDPFKLNETHWRSRKFFQCLDPGPTGWAITGPTGNQAGTSQTHFSLLALGERRARFLLPPAARGTQLCQLTLFFLLPKRFQSCDYIGNSFHCPVQLVFKFLALTAAEENSPSDRTR